MKILMQVILFTTASHVAIGQHNNPPSQPPPPGPGVTIIRHDSVNAPFVVVEKMPTYPGKEKALVNELRKCVAVDSNTHHFDETVLVSFVVEADGTAAHFNILRCQDDDVRRALEACCEKMGKWLPGEHRGKKVPVIRTLEIKFEKQ